MNTLNKNFLTFLGFTGLLLLLSYICAIPILNSDSSVFPFNDGSITAMLASRFDYPGILFRYWNTQVFFGQDLQIALLNSNAVWETLLGPIQFRRWGVLIVMVWAGASGYWAARQFDRSKIAASVSGILLALCGFTTTFAASGLTSRGFTLGWAAISLGLIESGRRNKNLLHYLLAGGALGISLSDTPDVGILIALACAAYLALSHLLPKFTKSSVKFFTPRIVLYVFASALLSWQAVSIMLATQTGGPGGQKTDKERYEWATQWSLPPVETWSMIACDFHGASSRTPDNLYWGKTGRSANWESTRQGFRSFRLSGYAVGIIPFMLVLFLINGLLQKRTHLNNEEQRTAWVLAGLSIAFLSLSWGHYFPSYKLFYSLPKMNLIRNPDKWIGPFMLTFSVLAAYAFDVFRYKLQATKEQPKVETSFWISLAALPVIALLGTVSIASSKFSFLDQLVKDQFDRNQALSAWQHAIHANLEAVILGLLFLAISFWLVKRPPISRPALSSSILILLGVGLTAYPLVRATGPFFYPSEYKHLQEENVLTKALDVNANNTRIKIIPDQLLNHWRGTSLRVRDYRIFDPLYVRSMNADDQRLIQSFQRNPLPLWRLGGIGRVLCNRQAATQLLGTGAFEEQLSFGAVQRGKQVYPAPAPSGTPAPYALLHFKQAIPLISLIGSTQNIEDSPEGDQEILSTLQRPDYNVSETVMVQGGSAPLSGGGGSVIVDSNTSTHAVIQTEATQPSLLLRLEKYSPSWQIKIDGEIAPLLRANFLFQGVEVPAGKHHVEFIFAPSQTTLIVAGAGRIALFLGLLTAGFQSLCASRKARDVKKEE